MVELLKKTGSSIIILKISKPVLRIICGNKTNYTNEQLKEIYQVFVGMDPLLNKSITIKFIVNSGFVYLIPESR